MVAKERPEEKIGGDVKKERNVACKGFRVRVHDEVYGDDIVLCLDSEEKYKEHLLRHYKIEQQVDHKAKGQTLRLDCVNRGGFDYFIWMPSFDWTVENQSTLAHELMHAVTGILSRRGVDINEGCHEAVSYLYSFFFHKFWNALKREHRKINKGVW